MFAWFVADLPSKRSFKAEEVAAKLSQHGAQMGSVSKNIRQAFARVRTLCAPGDIIVAFGSFLVVEALLTKLNAIGAKPLIQEFSQL